MTKRRLYKVLGSDDRPCHGGYGEYSLPHDGQPGKWMPPIEGALAPCKNGYHLCTIEQLPHWLDAHIYEAEGRGDHIECDDKIVYREVRLLRKCDGWNKRTARLFACDCAEHVLSIFERQCSDDDRPRRAIETARRYANCQATHDELAAAGAAAWDAAGTTAWAAAWDAAGAAAWAAAWDAAGAAAWDAAWAAAGAAAGTDERQWQAERLAEVLWEQSEEVSDD